MTEAKSDKVLAVNFPTRHQELDDLLKEIKDVIYERVGKVSVAAVLGVLRIIEHDLIRDQTDD